MASTGFVTFNITSETGATRTFKLQRETCGRLEFNGLQFTNKNKNGRMVYYDVNEQKTDNVNIQASGNAFDRIVNFLDAIANAVNSSGKEKDDIIDEKDFQKIDKAGQLNGYKVYPMDSENPIGRVRDVKTNTFLDYSFDKEA